MSSPRVTLISHFFNEQFLLPFWLRHHLPLFDHAILIDYHSTDASVAIIRELAPHWEVRTTRNPDFAAVPCDREVMDVERDIEGWKICLNTTEFLLHPDLRALAAAAPAKRGLAFQPVVMIDAPEERGRPIDPEQPLHRQCRHGRIADPEADPTYTQPAARGYRYLHPFLTGGYGPGRHRLGHRFEPAGAYYLWFGWAPVDQVKARKLQIQHRIPQWDRNLGHGVQHLMDDALFEARYRELAEHTTELWELPEYRAALDAFDALPG